MSHRSSSQPSLTSHSFTLLRQSSSFKSSSSLLSQSATTARMVLPSFPSVATSSILLENQFDSISPFALPEPFELPSNGAGIVTRPVRLPSKPLFKPSNKFRSLVFVAQPVLPKAKRFGSSQERHVATAGLLAARKVSAIHASIIPLSLFRSDWSNKLPE